MVIVVLVKMSSRPELKYLFHKCNLIIPDGLKIKPYFQLKMLLF